MLGGLTTVTKQHIATGSSHTRYRFIKPLLPLDFESLHQQRWLWQTCMFINCCWYSLVILSVLLFLIQKSSYVPILSGLLDYATNPMSFTKSCSSFHTHTPSPLIDPENITKITPEQRPQFTIHKFKVGQKVSAVEVSLGQCCDATLHHKFYLTISFLLMN